MSQLRSGGEESWRYCVEKGSGAWSDSTGRCPRSMSNACPGLEGLCAGTEPVICNACSEAT